MIPHYPTFALSNKILSEIKGKEIIYVDICITERQARKIIKNLGYEIYTLITEQNDQYLLS